MDSEIILRSLPDSNLLRSIIGLHIAEAPTNKVETGLLPFQEKANCDDARKDQRVTQFRL